MGCTKAVQIFVNEFNLTTKSSYTWKHWLCIPSLAPTQVMRSTATLKLIAPLPHFLLPDQVTAFTGSNLIIWSGLNKLRNGSHFLTKGRTFQPITKLTLLQFKHSTSNVNIPSCSANESNLYFPSQPSFTFALIACQYTSSLASFYLFCLRSVKLRIPGLSSGDNVIECVFCCFINVKFVFNVRHYFLQPSGP